MEMFERAFAMFSPFARREAQPEAGKPSGGPPTGGAGRQEIDEIRRQMEEMQQRLDRLSEKDNDK
jgi:polyhydroxyalkanoate synthesis regulator protein